MGQHTKVATCCYCGTRAALVLRGKTRHELSCAACGAPLHEMKSLRKNAATERSNVRDWSGRPNHKYTSSDDYRKKRRKRKKPIYRRFLEEAFDVLEDILD
ncbi:MAG: hypothetical protein AAF667_15770 [Pseudomonadota bacterium]